MSDCTLVEFDYSTDIIQLQLLLSSILRKYNKYFIVSINALKLTILRRRIYALRYFDNTTEMEQEIQYLNSREQLTRANASGTKSKSEGFRRYIKFIVSTNLKH